MPAIASEFRRKTAIPLTLRRCAFNPVPDRLAGHDRPFRYGTTSGAGEVWAATLRAKQHAEQRTSTNHYRISAAMLPAIRSAASWRESRARWA